MNCPYCGEHLLERDVPDCKNWRCDACKVLWADWGTVVHTWQRHEGERGWNQVPEGALLIRRERAVG